MDIAFHYCAVKALARLAGFAENEAQLIAEYSQFIDDYAARYTITLDSWPKVAEDLKIVNDQGKVALVTTGFETWLDMAHLVYETNRNNYLIPFHFITSTRLEDKDDVRPVVPATVGNDSIVGQAFQEIVTKKKRDTEALIHLGMILHVFADTYAHQAYSGQPTDGNKKNLVKAVRYAGQQAIDVTSDEKKSCSYISACGHAHTGHCPDKTYLEYGYKCEVSSGEIIIRTNQPIFKTASEQIYNAMVQITGGPTTPLPFSFIHDVAPFLDEAFSAVYDPQSSDGITALMDFYSVLFNRLFRINVTFHYDKQEVLKRHFSSKQKGYVITEEDLEAILHPNAHKDKKRVAILDHVVNVTSEFWYFTLYAAQHRDKVRHP